MLLSRTTCDYFSVPPKPSCSCGKCATCYFRIKKREFRSNATKASLRRSTPSSRKIAVKKKRRKPRRVSVVRDKGYREFLGTRLCLVQQLHPETLCSGRSFAAHTGNNGRGSKGADSGCVPLCRKHHDEMDGRLNTKVTTKEAFAKKYKLDLAKEAASHWELYQLEKES